MKSVFRIGTRKSALALWQANWVQAELLKHFPSLSIQLVTITTKGDKILDVPLADVTQFGQGWYIGFLTNDPDEPDPFQLELVSWHELPGVLVAPFMGNWPDDAQPNQFGQRAEKVQRVDVPGAAR